MPLRAKILPRQPQRATMATAHNLSKDPHEYFQAQRGDEPEDVVFHSLYGLRTIELNRPKKLNALNGSMIRKIGPRLIEWERSDMANVIVMKGAGGAFCAGGDVMQLANWNKEGPEEQQKSIDYFAQEYKLDHMIATYRKPYIAFMDGVTMGGGVGLSVHAPFRIATERTVFAMPETTIGFFPDVGASFFLPRLPGALGTYLALTSDRIYGANAFYTGLATHYLHSTTLPYLESRLAELRFKDYDNMSTRLRYINATLEEFCTGLPHDEHKFYSGLKRKAIDRCFSHDTIEEILQDLAMIASTTKPLAEWANKMIETLHKRSPTSVHVALRQMRVGHNWSIRETFVREHQIASKFMRHHDFVEGVTKQLSKPRMDPEWEPATLEDITPASKIADSFFKFESKGQLTLLNDNDYSQYPFPNYGLPTKEELKELLCPDATASRPERKGPQSQSRDSEPEPSESESEDEPSAFEAEPEAEPSGTQPLTTYTRSQVMAYFMEKRGQKQGLVEALDELISMHTERAGGGLLRWKEGQDVIEEAAFEGAFEGEEDDAKIADDTTAEKEEK